jgi:hypothetical protein
MADLGLLCLQLYRFNVYSANFNKSTTPSDALPANQSIFSNYTLNFNQQTGSRLDEILEEEGRSHDSYICGFTLY